MAHSQHVVVVGAGVIGLSIAHLLSSEPSTPFRITIVARDMPEDLDSQAFASPWAGANWSPINRSAGPNHTWQAHTVKTLRDMIPTGRVMNLPSRVFCTTEEVDFEPWYTTFVQNFRVLPLEEVPPEFKLGYAFDTLSLHPPAYLSWLKSDLIARGVEFVRKTIRSLNDAAVLAGPDGIIVNASSLGARSIVGVMDTKMYPIRGQTILVHAPHIQEFLDIKDTTLKTKTGEVTYIIPRPDGTVLLGGTFQEHNWDTSVDFTIAQGIFDRCAKLAPGLRDKATRIISHNVGLRPAREGGPRVEVEWVQLPIKGELVPDSESQPMTRKMKVVHAYGFGPAGYQMSWGAAEDAVALVKS